MAIDAAVRHAKITCLQMESMLWVLPAGLTEQPVSPAATNVKSKKGRDALEGASKAAGKRKHGGAAAAAAEPEPEAAQARGPEEGQAAPKAGSKTAGKRKHRRVAAAAAEPEAAQALGPALATRSWPYGAPEAGEGNGSW